ncbi:MAG: HTH domain-containing protein [Spirochaetales bacterium]|nr:HTH domain-containing protein [Spirochaetales bacterium]
MKIDRLLAITILLLSREKVTAKELSKRFEVTTRTIYRDIDAINMAGIPIISFPGKDGGFGIIDGFKLDRQIFTIKDMISILSPLEGVNKALKSESITQVIDKIHSLIPGNRKDEVSTSLSRMIVDIHPWGMSQDWKKQFITIQNSIENNRKQ